MRRFLSFFIRYVVTWPVLVIVGINIENAADFFGVSDQITENWAWLMSWMTWIYETATTPWVLNVALVALGAAIYEWFTFASRKFDARIPAYRLWLTKEQARSVAIAFARDGLFRRGLRSKIMISDLNDRLSILGLPQVPKCVGDDEEVNRAFARYLYLVAEGDFEFAKDVLDAAANKTTSEPPKLPHP